MRKDRTEAKTTLTPEELARLDSVAVIQARSRSQVVRLAVREYCRSVEVETPKK